MHQLDLLYVPSDTLYGNRLQKRGVKTRRTTTKYTHMHTAFVEALNKLLTENLFKVQDAQELNDPKKVLST